MKDERLRSALSALDLLTDEELARGPLPVPKAEAPDPWWEKFRYDLYDWNDPVFLRKNRGRYGFMPILLKGGYFMMVSKKDHKRMTRHRDGSPKLWCAKIDRDKEGNITAVYARRGGRGKEPKTVYAHRELLYCLHREKGVVDHKNGWGLDNRRGTVKRPVNLRNTNHSENTHNANRVRLKNFGLPRGVERRGTRFGGIRAKRLSRNKVLTIRSKVTWATPEPAARWYQNQLKALHRGRKNWVHNPTARSIPIFPRRLRRDVSKKRATRGAKATRAEARYEIPF